MANEINQLPITGELVSGRSPFRLICRTRDHFEEAIGWARSSILLARDVETIPHITRAKKKQPFVMTVDSMTGINSEGEMRSYAWQLTQQKSALLPPPEHMEMAIQTMRIVNKTAVAKVLHNGVYDSAWYLRYGAPLENYAWDTMTMWWARFPDVQKTLDVVSSVLLDDHRFWKMGRKEEDFLAHTLYAMADTETTLRCAIPLLHWMLEDKAMRQNYNDAHRRCLIGLGMSMKGIPMDMAVREELRNALIQDADQKLARLRFLTANAELNPNSPKQMAELLYSVLGAKPRNAKGRELKRLGGNAKLSTGAVAMRAMRAEHPILGRIISAIDEAKTPAKQLSNVIGLEQFDGRFRTSYDGVGTSSTRYSSRKDAFGFGGNAQNIRKKYRRIMTSDPNCFYLEIDFSAADDVFVSYESEEQKKIDLVESGMDTHSYNASQVFFTNWTYEEVVKGKKADDPRVVHPITGIRQITKKTTHGANYLMAGMTLLMSAGRDAIVGAAKHLGYEDAGRWSTDRLAEFCDELDQKYRRFYVRFARGGSNSFYSDLLIMLLRTQSYETIFGYTKRFIGDPRDQATLREAAAMVGQANTAGRVNMALDELEFGIRMVRFRDGDAPDADEEPLPVSDLDHGCSLRLQTHDSVTYQVNFLHRDWKEGVRRIFHVLRRPVLCKGRIIRVGIEADVAWNWAHDVTLVNSVEDVQGWLDSQMQESKGPFAVLT